MNVLELINYLVEECGWDEEAACDYAYFESDNYEPEEYFEPVK